MTSTPSKHRNSNKMSVHFAWVSVLPLSLWWSLELLMLYLRLFLSLWFETENTFGDLGHSFLRWRELKGKEHREWSCSKRTCPLVIIFWAVAASRSAVWRNVLRRTAYRPREERWCHNDGCSACHIVNSALGRAPDGFSYHKVGTKVLPTFSSIRVIPPTIELVIATITYTLTTYVQAQRSNWK